MSTFLDKNLTPMYETDKNDIFLIWIYFVGKNHYIYVPQNQYIRKNESPLINTKIWNQG